MAAQEPLTRQALVAAMAAGAKFDFLLFWGHTARRGGKDDKVVLSQWYPQSFQVDGIDYPTAEHYMMAGKARLFRDELTLARILAAATPKDAKQLGREVRDYDDKQWRQHRFEIVVAGNLAKFGQNPALRDFLLQSGDKVIVEASPVDKIWGIGLAADAPAATQPAKWQGENLLGFALMRVRQLLREP